MKKYIVYKEVEATSESEAFVAFANEVEKVMDMSQLMSIKEV